MNKIWLTVAVFFFLIGVLSVIAQWNEETTWPTFIAILLLISLSFTSILAVGTNVIREEWTSDACSIQS